VAWTRANALRRQHASKSCAVTGHCKRGRRAFLIVPTPADRPTAFDRLFVSAARNGPDADAVGRIPGDLPDADRPKDPTVGQREGHHAPIGLQCALARGTTVSRPDFNLPVLKAKAEHLLGALAQLQSAQPHARAGGGGGGGGGAAVAPFTCMLLCSARPRDTPEVLPAMHMLPPIPSSPQPTLACVSKQCCSSRSSRQPSGSALSLAQSAAP